MARDFQKTSYSFIKCLNFSFCKLWSKSGQSLLQLFICDCPTAISVDVGKHLFHPLDLFFREIFSNDLREKRGILFEYLGALRQIIAAFFNCSWVHKLHTLRASFLSLFMTLNCFILDSTALSIGLSDASPPSLSHGCSALTSSSF